MIAHEALPPLPPLTKRHWIKQMYFIGPVLENYANKAVKWLICSFLRHSVFHSWEEMCEGQAGDQGRPWKTAHVLAQVLTKCRAAWSSQHGGVPLRYACTWWPAGDRWTLQLRWDLFLSKRVMRRWPATLAPPQRVAVSQLVSLGDFTKLFMPFVMSPTWRQVQASSDPNIRFFSKKKTDNFFF